MTRRGSSAVRAVASRVAILGIALLAHAGIAHAQPCEPSQQTLCLAGGRFEIKVDWRNQYSGASGHGIMIPRSPFTGFAAFDNWENVELVFKVLQFNGVTKVFYSQLTDLLFTLHMRDTVTGASETYSNTAGNCGALDPDAFKTLAGKSINTQALRPRLNRRIRQDAFNTAAGSCRASSGKLCLLDKRFEVSVTWRNQYNGQTGTGHTQPLTNLSGVFDYGDASNVELMVKALDFGGGHILFLYGALSDFEYAITLKDTTTGTTKVYRNPAGTFCGGLDTDVLGGGGGGGGGGGTGELAGTWEGTATSTAVRGSCMADHQFQPLTVSGRWVYSETAPGVYRVRQTLPIGNVFTCEFTARQSGSSITTTPEVTHGVAVCTDQNTVCPGPRPVRMVLDLDATRLEGVVSGTSMRLDGTAVWRVTDARTGEFLGNYEVDAVQVQTKKR